MIKSKSRSIGWGALDAFDVLERIARDAGYTLDVRHGDNFVILSVKDWGANEVSTIISSAPTVPTDW